MSTTDHFISNVASVHIERSRVLGHTEVAVIRIQVQGADGSRHYVSMHSAGPIQITGDIDVPQEEKS